MVLLYQQLMLLTQHIIKSEDAKFAFTVITLDIKLRTYVDKPQENCSTLLRHHHFHHQDIL